MSCLWDNQGLPDYCDSKSNHYWMLCNSLQSANFKISAYLYDSAM